MKTRIALLMLPFVLTACATPDPSVQQERKPEREYVTGSNVPRKNGDLGGVRVIPAEAWKEMQSKSGMVKPTEPDSR
jgi:hypothetical protein